MFLRNFSSVFSRNASCFNLQQFGNMVSLFVPCSPSICFCFWYLSQLNMLNFVSHIAARSLVSVQAPGPTKKRLHSRLKKCLSSQSFHAMNLRSCAMQISMKPSWRKHYAKEGPTTTCSSTTTHSTKSVKQPSAKHLKNITLKLKLLTDLITPNQILTGLMW